MTNEEQFKKFKEMKMLFEPMTKGDFLEQFKVVLEMIKDTKNKNLQELKEIKELYNKLIKKAKTDIDNFSKKELSTIKNSFNSSMSKLEAKASQITNGIDGKDGKDADETKIVSDVLSQIRIPEIKEIKDDLPKMGTQIRDALELLQGEERLNIDAINGLEEILKELKERKLGGGGGGFSKIHMESKFIDNEIPSGTINGTNKTFTINKAPNPISSLKVYWNGQLLLAGSDYTLSGTTITMEEAPDSGDNFWIDYRI